MNVGASKKVLKFFDESIDYLLLTVSQATAMEITDRTLFRDV